MPSQKQDAQTKLHKAKESKKTNLMPATQTEALKLVGKKKGRPDWSKQLQGLKQARTTLKAADVPDVKRGKHDGAPMPDKKLQTSSEPTSAKPGTDQSTEPQDTTSQKRSDTAPSTSESKTNNRHGTKARLLTSDYSD